MMSPARFRLEYLRALIGLQVEMPIFAITFQHALPTAAFL